MHLNHLIFVYLNSIHFAIAYYVPGLPYSQVLESTWQINVEYFNVPRGHC